MSTHQDERSRLLGEGNIKQLLIQFSTPAIIGMSVNALYNVVDRIFVGKGVGSLAITGITVSFPVMLIVMAFTMLVTLGATSLISIRLGQNKIEEAERIVGNSLVLLVVISALITGFGLAYMEPMLLIFGASAEVMPYAKDFVRIILIGVIFQGIGFGMNNYIRAEGNPRIAMLTMILAAVLNIILNPIFIFGFKLGIAGSALATVISQAVAAIWVLSYFFSDKSLLKIRAKNLRLDLPVMANALFIGLSPFAMQLIASVIAVFYNKALGEYSGDLAIAAYGIIHSIIMLIFMPILGINQGAQPIIGFNYGARQYQRVKKALKLAVIAASTITVVGFIIVQAFPHALMAIFSDNDQQLIEIGARALRLNLLMFPLVGFQVAASNYFQAIGKPIKSLFLSTSRQLIFLLPALLILPPYLGLDGIWLAGPVSDLIAALVAYFLLAYDLKALGKSKAVPKYAK